MAKPLNLLAYPLDWVFSSPAHIPILRTLQDSREGLSGRAIARRAGINHQTCSRALQNLVAIGIILRQGSGHTQLLRLNFDNKLVNQLIVPLLRGEKDLFLSLRKEIADKFKKVALSITVFGSLARKEGRLGSDMDVLFVVPSGKKETLQKKLDDFSVKFFHNYGVRFSSIVLTPSEGKKRFRKSDPLLKNILNEGIDLLPRTIRRVVNVPKAT